MNTNPPVRDELFDDVARQFEEMHQPLSMSWMQTRSVSMEELTALSHKIALILRGYRALEPQDRIAFVTSGVFRRRTMDEPAETTLGRRQTAASDPEQHDSENHDETKSHP